MDENESEQQKEEAMKSLRRLRKLSYPLALVMILLILTLGFMGVPPWLAVPIGMIAIIVPVLIVGVRIDRKLGIQDFKRIHGTSK